MDNKIKGCVNMRIISAKIYNEERKIVLFFESEIMPSRSEIAETANFWRKKLKADDSITIEIKLKEIEKFKDEKTEDICKKVVDSANASAAPWEAVPTMPAEPEENFYPEYIGPADEEPDFYPADFAPMPEVAPEIGGDFYADIPAPIEEPVTTNVNENITKEEVISTPGIADTVEVSFSLAEYEATQKETIRMAAKNAGGRNSYGGGTGGGNSYAFKS